jgi:hypothetical protein
LLHDVASKHINAAMEAAIIFFIFSLIMNCIVG